MRLGKAPLGVLVGLVVFVTAGAAQANEVLSGDDLWVTPPGGAFHDFSTSPIPADFFYPGSDPFFAQVPLDGIANGTCGSDTAVRRLDDADPLPIGASQTIDIEIIELSLVSSDPITVTGVNPDEPWLLEVGLSPNPQPTGQMTIKHQVADGGTYDSFLPVCPLFVFQQQVPPFLIQQLDLCQSAFPPVEIGTVDAPWSHLVVMPLVCPGVSTPNFIAGGPHTGPHPDAVPLEDAIEFPVIPAMGPVGLTVFGGLLVTALVIVTRRKRARA